MTTEQPPPPPGTILAQIDLRPAPFGGEGITWRVRVIAVADAEKGIGDTDSMDCHHAVTTATPVIGGIEYHDQTVRSFTYITGYKGDGTQINPPREVLSDAHVEHLLDAGRRKLKDDAAAMFEKAVRTAYDLEKSLTHAREWFKGELVQRKWASDGK